MKPFRSKLEAFANAIRIFICKDCGTVHYSTQQKELYFSQDISYFAKKPKNCINCQCKTFEKFDSKKELNRFNQLQYQQKIGEIKHLNRQVIFDVRINGYKITKYIADHTYYREGKYIVEDVKGSKRHVTEEFKLKMKLIQALWDCEFNIID